MKPLVIDPDSNLFQLATKIGGLPVYEFHNNDHINTCSFIRAVILGGILSLGICALALALLFAYTVITVASVLGILHDWGFVSAATGYWARVEAIPGIYAMSSVLNIGVFLALWLIFCLDITVRFFSKTGDALENSVYWVKSKIHKYDASRVKKLNKPKKPSVIKELYKARKEKYCLPVVLTKGEK